MISFIGNNIPFVDNELLQSIQDVISTVDLGSHSPNLIARLEDRRRSLSPHSDLTDKVANQMESASWRQQIRLIVGEMMAPDNIIWTDDDEDSTDYYFAQRALQKIKDRFEM